ERQLEAAYERHPLDGDVVGCLDRAHAVTIPEVGRNSCTTPPGTWSAGDASAVGGSVRSSSASPCSIGGRWRIAARISFFVPVPSLTSWVQVATCPWNVGASTALASNSTQEPRGRQFADRARCTRPAQGRSSERHQTSNRVSGFW